MSKDRQIMKREELELFAREAAKGLKTEKDLHVSSDFLYRLLSVAYSHPTTSKYIPHHSSAISALQNDHCHM